MVRGIERRAIFLDDVDREDFLRRLSNLSLELGFLCFAWALMPNHAHLVLRSSSARISRLMARLGTGYARRFNERHGRVGHLFQNRFRSRRVVDDADLLGLVLYVTRNPLEAGLVADGAALARWPWCGLGALLGECVPRPFEGVADTLALFAANPRKARGRLRERLAAPLPASPDAPAPAASALPTVRLPGGFDEILREVAVRHGVTVSAMCSRRRTLPIAAARRELAMRAVAELGWSAADVGRGLGVSAAAVSWMLARGRQTS
jgi:REP element-mobilizing transposase RayT